MARSTLHCIRGAQGPDFIAKPDRLSTDKLLRGVSAIIRDHDLVDAKLAGFHEELGAVIQDVEDRPYL